MTKKIPNISILTLVNDDFNLHMNYFESIIKNFSGIDFEILLYSWDTSDSFGTYLKDKFYLTKNVKIFYGPNIGFGAANNYLSSKARYDFLFILNPDTQIINFDSSGFYQESLTQDLISPEIYYKLGNNVLKNDILTTDVTFYPQPSSSYRNARYVDGCAILIKKSRFESIGGFDDNIFIFSEDVDLSFRLRLKGTNALVSSNVRVIHESGGTVAGGRYLSSSHQTSYFRRFNHEFSLIYLGIKYWPIPFIPIWFFTLIFSQIITSVYFLFKGKIRLSLAPLIAYFHILINFRSVLKARNVFKKQHSFLQLSSLYFHLFRFPSRFKLMALVLKSLILSTRHKFLL